jgi:hypothetical protein
MYKGDEALLRWKSGFRLRYASRLEVKIMESLSCTLWPERDHSDSPSLGSVLETLALVCQQGTKEILNAWDVYQALFQWKGGTRYRIPGSASHGLSTSFEILTKESRE